jgi:putative transcriptional regulator
MAESLRGNLLLASPEMGDPNFERAVILMVEHDGDGAMGLIVNRPTDVSVADVLPDDESVELSLGDGGDAVLYRGGPCEGPLMVLHGGGSAGQGEVAFPLPSDGDSKPVMDGVWFASERSVLEPALGGALRPARFFAGYAGWGAGQLESELGSASWTVVPAEASLLWNRGSEGSDDDVREAGDALWRRLVRQQMASQLFKGWNPKIVPRDPSMN